MANERLFDPAEVFSAEVEANATKREPLPIGQPLAQIMELKFSDGMSAAKPGKPSRPWARIDAVMEITDPEYLAQVGDGTREKAVAFYGVMVEMNGKQIKVGPDVNVELGKLREAAGVNGQPLNALVGSWVRLNVVHEPHYKRPEEITHKIESVAPATQD